MLPPPESGHRTVVATPTQVGTGPAVLYREVRTLSTMSGRANRTRVLVADDHPLFRGAVGEAVKERAELELVGEARDGGEAVEAIERLKPDVAVLDVRMPGLEGIEVLERVKRDGLHTRVMFLSAFMDPDFAYKAVAAGARAYVSKEADSAAICDAVVAVARGDTVFAPEVQAGLADAIRLREAGGDRPLLTPREQEILELTAVGLSAPEIARRIHLSPATVKTHLQHLYEKLGSRIERRRSRRPCAAGW